MEMINEYKKDEFQFRRNFLNPQIEIMALNTHKWDECVEYIKLNNIQGIEINDVFGSYKAENLDLLEKLIDCNIKVINLVNEYKDITVISKFVIN